MIHTAIVCGSRKGIRPPRASLIVPAALASFVKLYAPELAHVVVGSPVGVDRQAFDWAIDSELDATIAMAKWALHGRPGGPMRNRRMLDVYIPDAVLAFPGGPGTADMIKASYAHVAGQQSAFDFARPADAAPRPMLQLWKCEFAEDWLDFEWKRHA